LVRDNPDYAEMLRRFEYEMNVEESRDTDDLFRKFVFWQGRQASIKQRILLRQYAREHGIRERLLIGISRRKGKLREELRRHYTTHVRKGKRVMVARIPKGMKGAGRFAKRR
jgi:hypothetical protein